jgi:hypothetical protein
MQPAPEAIAMTAPVVRGQATGMETMAFLLPAQFTMETAPTPTDPRVKLSERPPQTVAVYGFTCELCSPLKATRCNQKLSNASAWLSIS